MNRRRSKTSRFFNEKTNQDEKVAITPTDQEADFDAGIERLLRKKPSRFFRKQNDKPLPSPPLIDKSEDPLPPLGKVYAGLECVDATVEVTAETASAENYKPLPSRPVSCKSLSSETEVTPHEENIKSAPKTKQTDTTLKTCPTFASLRKSSSRILRFNAGGHNAPPPPVPQIPIDIPTPKPHRPLLRPFESTRSGRSSHSGKVHIASISRPISSVQSHLAPDFESYKVPFTQSTGLPPRRPARPSSVDEDLVAMARDGGACTVVHTPNRARTFTASTVSSTWSPVHSRAGSEEACSRLGLPSGHSSLSAPRSPVFDSPLAANFPVAPNMPLPFRDSDGSIQGYSRLSAYVKVRRGYGSGGYEDGVYERDRDVGPIEMYCEARCADWTLQKRVNGGLGERGMLFKDRWDRWHLVKDI